MAEADPPQQPRPHPLQCLFPRHTRSFFGAQVDDRDKQIRQDGQDQVVMKPAPTAPLEVIQTQIGLAPLEILLDVPA